MRTILFTGKGGVGKSTIAAATALAAARSGRRTLVLSTDAAHSLADAFGREVGAEPTEVEPRLWVQQVDAQRRFERSWAEVQGYLLDVFEVAGVEPLAAQELTVLPGAEEVLALLELRDRAKSGDWDVVVVDCAPTAETLRLLALPEALGWYVRRVLPVQRGVVRALRPVLARAAGVPMPGDSVFDALERLHGDLGEVRDLLAGPDATVRLVMTPESVVLAESRRTWSLLSLFGYRVDAVVVNRVFPSDGADTWRAGWAQAQEAVLTDVGDSFAGLPVLRSTYRAREPVGVTELHDLAVDLYGSADPLAGADGPAPLRVTREGDSAVLHLTLPLLAREDVDLARKGDELVVSVASYRRLLSIPPGLARHRVTGARVRDGELQVRFEEEPAATQTDPDIEEEA